MIKTTLITNRQNLQLTTLMGKHLILRRVQWYGCTTHMLIQLQKHMIHFPHRRHCDMNLFCLPNNTSYKTRDLISCYSSHEKPRGAIITHHKANQLPWLSSSSHPATSTVQSSDSPSPAQSSTQADRPAAARPCVSLLDTFRSQVGAPCTSAAKQAIDAYPAP
jgi:hypothetical protein